MEVIVDRQGTSNVLEEAGWDHLAVNKHRGGVQGASANTYLLGAFLYHSRLRSLLEGKQDELPGGLGCWKEVCDVLFVTLPAFLTVPELATRILFLVDKQLLDEQQPGGSAERKSLESSNLVGGAIMFLYDWLRGFHLYLSSHQLCEVKTLIYDICTRMHVHYTKQKRGTSTTATTITAASSSNRLDDNHKELEKLRNTINEIVSERSWIEVGCIPRKKKLNHHGFSSLSEYSVSHSIAGGYRCVAAPFVAQTKGEWSGAAVQARRKTVKDALAKAAHVHINVFGGAGLLGSLNDESDEDEFLPFSPSTGRRSEAGAGDVVEVDYPVPRVPSGVSLLQDPSTIDFWTVDPMEIARQWTLVDHGLFCAIPPACFLQLTWTEPRHKVRTDGLLTPTPLILPSAHPTPPPPPISSKRNRTARGSADQELHRPLQHGVSVGHCLGASLSDGPGPRRPLLRPDFPR